VIGVGDPDDGALSAAVDDAGFSSSDPIDRVLELGAGVVRSFWYVGLSLLVGGAYLSWSRRRRAPAAATRSRPDDQLCRSAGWWARTGWWVAVASALGGWAMVVVSRLRYFDVDGSWAARTLDAARATPAIGWAMAALAIACGTRALRRLSTVDDDRPASIVRSDVRLLAAVVVVAAFWSVLAGHAATPDAPALELVSLTAHLLAAAAWVGPLAVLSLTAVTAGWRRTDSADRRRLLGGVFAGYANLAFVAFVVLVLSGVYSAWATLGGRWFENAYSWTLVGKLTLIAAVIAPLAVHHDRVVRRAPIADEVGASSGGTSPGAWSFLRSVRVEALALVTVLGLAALLGGLDPGYDRSGETQLAAGAAPDLFAAEAVDDPAECANRAIGKPTCYREYFASVMADDGADVGVAAIADLAVTDEYVRVDCHQIAHDLGEDAVEFYGDLGTALSFEASACWSGYYHGAVETEMSGLDDETLLTVVPRVCDDAAEERYSFTHYNCVHGVGHGLMLRFDADLWRVIPYCETYPAEDVWERRSCLGGAFMQNIVSAQEGESASLRDDDLLYPCTELEGTYRQECLGMQTSWVLWKIGYDYAAGFAVCDGLDEESRSTCYQSMGRDISGGSNKDVATVVKNCDLGDESHRQSCIVGASLDAVYDDHGTSRATQLCAAVDARWRRACEDARDSAASTF
jgi:putative copper export protein